MKCTKCEQRDRVQASHRR